MGPEVLSRVFEPFFTTMESGKGTGLGLATVYGKVYLPLTEEAAAVADALSLESIVPNGTETILYREDEDSLREVTREYLKNKGYTVLDASEREQAIAAAGNGSSRIDLLLTDVILPGSSGVQLAQRLSGTHPHLRVLYVSGYTADTIIHHGGHDPSFAFLTKPFSLPALARKIRSILDSEPQNAARAQTARLTTSA